MSRFLTNLGVWTLAFALILSVLSSRQQTKLVEAQTSLTDSLVELSEALHEAKAGGKCI